MAKKRKGKRKLTAFNRCVKGKLLAATYKNPKQWRKEFAKVVGECKTKKRKTKKRKK